MLVFNDEGMENDYCDDEEEGTKRASQIILDGKEVGQVDGGCAVDVRDQVESSRPMWTAISCVAMETMQLVEGL